MIQTKVRLDENRVLSVWDNQKKSLQPVIFLHGLTGNGYQLQHFAQHLNHEFRVITLDFRGRGNSSKPNQDSNLDTHVQDVIDLIEVLELKRVVLVGYSMGGFIAAQVASQLPLSKLVLLDGCADMDEHQNKIVEPTFERLKNTYPSQENYVETVVGNYAKMGVKDSLELRTAIAYEIKEENNVWIPKSYPNAIVSDWKSFYQYDVANVCKNIDCEVLLIEARGSIGNHGALFEEEHYQTTEKNLKKFMLEITNENHYTLVFTPQPKLNECIETFLK